MSNTVFTNNYVSLNIVSSALFDHIILIKSKKYMFGWWRVYTLGWTQLLYLTREGGVGFWLVAKEFILHNSTFDVFFDSKEIILVMH